MNDLITLFKNDINNLVDELLNLKLINDFNRNSISIDFSSKSKQGDLSTNILIILLNNNNNNNNKISEYVNKYFLNLGYVKNINIAKAGFINIFIEKDFLIAQLKNLINEKINYDNIKKQKINIEFVSANPTGPIHVAHMRGAVLGDVISSVMSFIGHEVTKEYYVNDAGSQISILGNSLFKRYKELFGYEIQLSDNEYPGEYLIDIAKDLRKLDGDKWLNHKDKMKLDDYFQSFAVKYLLEKIKKDLSLINISFDKFTLESNIVEENLIEKVFSSLKNNDLIYEGYLEKPLGDEVLNWEPRKQLLFRSSNFFDDLDRPFKKDNGQWTYFANDSAYHFDKYNRGYDKLINIWGADHIGYVPRMLSIVEAFTQKNNYLEIVICQIVRLIKKDQQIRMSKRSGNFVTINEIFNEVGKDPLRYFMISTKSETPMDFNLDKVIEKNKDNPVFYCQYAYARASSVIKKSNEFKKFKNFKNSLDNIDKKTISEHEWEIILKLLTWPYVLISTAQTKQTHKITNFLEDLCYHFHSFWNKGKDDQSLRFINEDNPNQTISKLIWIEAFRKILKQAFDIIGIDSPESM